MLFPLGRRRRRPVEKVAPGTTLSAAIGRLRATICFAADATARLRWTSTAVAAKTVSAWSVAAATFDAWLAATGIRIIDGLGSTEMLHIFIGSPEGAVRAGATGKPVPGYEARVIDEGGRELPPGTAGRLAVRGPTGCRYLGDRRQTEYVQQGWNVTGDTYIQDADGYFRYQARSDDMIISAGYNIAGPEVETVLLTHPAVAECGVVGQPDAERGQIVKAYVVLKQGFAADMALTRALQEHVKSSVAPFKYPRAIEYVTSLPRTETGKLQRFALRRIAAESAASKLAS